MTLALDTLPDDAASLKALIATLAAERHDLAARCGRLEQERMGLSQDKAVLAAEVDRLAAQNARLDHIVTVLRRKRTFMVSAQDKPSLRFGRSSERLTEDQMNLALEDIEAGFAAEDAKAEKQSGAVKRQGAKTRRANRGHLPAHLPREEVVIEPENKTCPCGCALHVIGEDVSERLDRIPAKLAKSSSPAGRNMPAAPAPTASSRRRRHCAWERTFIVSDKRSLRGWPPHRGARR